MSLDVDLPSVLGDRIQLQQVLINLLVNAAEAMRDVPAERRRLVIGGAHETIADHAWAVITVEDAGVGLGGMGLSISHSGTQGLAVNRSP